MRIVHGVGHSPWSGTGREFERTLLLLALAAAVLGVIGAVEFAGAQAPRPVVALAPIDAPTDEPVRREAPPDRAEPLPRPTPTPTVPTPEVAEDLPPPDLERPPEEVGPPDPDDAHHARDEDGESFEGP